MTNFKKAVGHRIRVARTDARMTQEDLAKASGVSPTGIVNIENGYSSPTLENAYKIAKAIGCTVNDLCGLGQR